MNLDFEPLQEFFEEDYSPTELARLLDDLMYDYMFLIARQQQEQKELIHEQADMFIFYIKKLRDILPKCEK